MASAPNARLSASQLSQLSDQLREATKAASDRRVVRYPLSHDAQVVIDVARLADFPSPGLQTAVSLGLSQYSWLELDFPDRIELVQVWNGPEAPNERLLMVVLESIIMTGRPPKPGAVYLNAAGIADLPELSDRMPHALIMFPLLWSDGLIKADLAGTKVWFLQVVPIFEAERAFIRREGFAKFEELLSYDVMDLHEVDRVSHV